MWMLLTYLAGRWSRPKSLAPRRDLTVNDLAQARAVAIVLTITFVVFLLVSLL